MNRHSGQRAAAKRIKRVGKTQPGTPARTKAINKSIKGAVKSDKNNGCALVLFIALGAITIGAGYVIQVIA